MLKRFNAWVDRQATVVQACVWLTIIFVIRTFIFGLYVVPSPSMETTMLVGERFLAGKGTLWFTGIKHGDVISFNDPTYQYADNMLANWWQRYVGITSPSDWGPSNWTKRVIGVPGDHIQGVIENGKPVVYRNAQKLDEPYVNTYPLITLWSPEASRASWNMYAPQPTIRRSYDPEKPYSQQPFYQINPGNIVSIQGIKRILRPGQPAPDVSDQFDVTLGDNEYWVMGDNRLASSDSRAWGKLDGQLIHGKIRLCLFSIDSDFPWWIGHLLSKPIDFFAKIRWSRTMRIVR